MMFSESIWFVFALAELDFDDLDQARCVMEKPSPRKTFDVSAKTVLSRRTTQDAETPPAQLEGITGAAMSENSTFDDSEFEDELADEFDQDLEREFDLLMPEDNFAQDDYWGDEIEQEQTSNYGNYFHDEFDLHSSEDPLVDLFEDKPSLSDIRQVIPNLLAQGMLKALNAPRTADFLELTVRSLDATIARGYSMLGIRDHNSNTKQSQQKVSSNYEYQTKKQNGYSSSFKQDIELQPVLGSLKQLRIMIQRYAKRGLQEWDVLEDAIALLTESQATLLVPILAGFAARLSLKPILEQLQQMPSAPVREALFKATSKATRLLQQHHALTALPGLAASVGQHVLRDRAFTRLPQEFYQAATRVAANPRLQQKLAQFNFVESEAKVASQQRLPTRLRLNGPIEILLRRPQGQ